MRNFNGLCYVLNHSPNAIACVYGSESYSDIKGRVMFYQLRDYVIVRAEVSGLPKCDKPCESPIFAFHIHSGEECTGDKTDSFKNAGTHYNPNNCKHPYHAGDMPPLMGTDGKAFSMFMTDRFTVNEVIGRTVIIHLHPDDFAAQPSGNSGEKIACGVINPNCNRR